MDPKRGSSKSGSDEGGSPKSDSKGIHRRTVKPSSSDESRPMQGIASRSPEKPSRVPAYLMPFVELDKQWTKKLAFCAGTESALAKLRPHMKALEWSCHGVPWLAACMAMLFLFRGPWAQQVFLNLLMALVLDVIFVAIVKAVFRRGRPEQNHDDMMMTPGFIDIYAFPSGHASRAIMVSLVLFGRFDLGLNLVLGSLLVAWSVVVSASRVLLGRHHIGDVVAGVALGYLEYVLVDWIWLGPEAAASFLSFLDADAMDA